MKKITVRDLVKRLSAREIISDMEIIGAIDHDSLAQLLQYDGQTDEWFFREKFILRDCKIENIDLRSINFENRFELRNCAIGSAVFTGVKFRKGANFSTTQFFECPSFYQTWFFWTAYFSDTVFHAGAEFGFAFFKEWALFHHAHFSENADFRSASFEKRALFGGIRAAKVDFTYSRFYDLMILSTAEIDSSKLDKLIMEESRIFGSMDLSGVECVTLSLAKAKCTGSIKLRGAKFDKVDLTDAAYNELDVDLDQIFIAKPNRSKLIFEDGANSPRSLKIIYMRLKVNYQKLGMRDEEDELYRRLRGVEAQTKRETRNYLPYIIDKYILDLLFGYGTLPYRAFASSVALVLLYSMLYVLFGISKGNPGLWGGQFSLSGAFDSLYFSCITFTTIGYGDITPTGVARFLAATEGFFGIFMMGAFSVTFARKLLR